MADDYLSGSQFGNVAGALLARKRRGDRREMQRALLATTLFETIGAFQRRQKTKINEDLENIKTNYQDIFVNNKEEWNGAQVNRQAIAEADRIGEKAYLNKKVNENIDYLLQDLGVSWRDKNMQTKEVQDQMFKVYNAQLKREKEILDLLRQNPVNTYDTFSQYNQAAKNEYLSALAAVQDDPTRKGLISAAFNRIFRTEKDKEGNLTSTNAEKIELENALNFAKQERQKFRESVTQAETLLNNRYSSLVGKPPEELENNIITAAKKPFTEKQINDQMKANAKFLEDEEFMKIPLNIPVIKTDMTIENINDIPELSTDNVEEINIKKAWKDNKIKVYNPDTQELSTISSFDMRQYLAEKSLSLNSIKLKNGINPTVGASIVNESLQSFSNEGRFVRLKDLKKDAFNVLGFEFFGEQLWDADDILFIAPSKTGQNLLRNKVTVSDAVAINQSQGTVNPEDVIGTGGVEGPPEPYNGLNALGYFQSEGFLNLSKNQQLLSVNEMKEVYPDNAEEIGSLYNLVLENNEKESIKQLSNNKVETSSTDETESERMARYERQANESLLKGITSIPQAVRNLQTQKDVEILNRYVNEGYSNTAVLKRIFRKYGLDEDSNPEAVANFLETFNDSSLLSRQ
jgi:hypothetical protein